MDKKFTDLDNEASMPRDEGLDAVVAKIQKLLNLRDKNPNEAEAAAAAAKVQALLEAYNIDMATIEQGNSGSGKREEARTSGGMYVYERELWKAIADLNFCVYITTRARVPRLKSQPLGPTKIVFQHRLIGRVVNTRATYAMGNYIQSTIERLCRERFPANNQFFMREAVAFREGMADKIKVRLWERRRESQREEDRKAQEAAARAKATGIDTAFALTLKDVGNSEEKGNYDFIHGEGAWDRREAAHEKWDKEYAERRAAQAKADKEAEEAYTAWAAENPEEAAKAEKQRLAKERAAERARQRRGGGWGRYRAPDAREQRQSSDYYDQGQEAGAKVSLEPQMDRGETKRIK
ncbi:MAG: hypothetical protein JWN75_1178 [Candidatus Saccharibacteria bacterium]|nr:hypothetical protein [Candidatus Saccharibacteria bacterium]